MNANELLRKARLIVPLMVIWSAAALLSPSTALADELEEGIKYECNSTGLSIQEFTKDGGGLEDPFPVYETTSSAVWNIDRINRDRLPIIKHCKIGTHQVTTVVAERCAQETGIGVSVAVYSDAQVSVGAKAKNWKAAIISDHEPLIDAEVFGDLCWRTEGVSFSAISVKASGLYGNSLNIAMH